MSAGTATRPRPHAALSTRTERGGFRRWLRSAYKVVVPTLIGVLLVIGTFVAHDLQSVDVIDPHYLNPDSTASIGGSTLADALRARGVTVQRATSTLAALRMVKFGGPATLFVPALELVDPDLKPFDAPSGTRIVVVAPASTALAGTDWPVRETRSRWAPVTTSPACALPAAQAAGVARVDGVEYAAADPDATSCYDGGLVTIGAFDGQVTVVGASDPFRNDRIGEDGNEALATGLLGSEPRVVWLDIHRLEVPPPVPVPGGSTGSFSSPFPSATAGSGTATASDSDGGSSGPDSDPGNPPPSSNSKATPLQQILPPWVWAGIGLLVLAGLAAAIAAARRMGPPVTEPLPVVARLGETVAGRGRLYRRAGDRTAVLRILQSAAIERIRAVADLPPDASRWQVIEAAKVFLNGDEEEAARILYGEVNGDDEDLRHAVASLDALVEATGSSSTGSNSSV